MTKKSEVNVNFILILSMAYNGNFSEQLIFFWKFKITKNDGLKQEWLEYSSKKTEAINFFLPKTNSSTSSMQNSPSKVAQKVKAVHNHNQKE